MFKFIKKIFKKEEIIVDERLEHMLEIIIQDEIERKKWNKHHIETMKEIKEWLKQQKKVEPKGRIYSF